MELEKQPKIEKDLGIFDDTKRSQIEDGIKNELSSLESKLQIKEKELLEINSSGDDEWIEMSNKVEVLKNDLENISEKKAEDVKNLLNKYKDYLSIEGVSVKEEEQNISDEIEEDYHPPFSDQEIVDKLLDSEQELVKYESMVKQRENFLAGQQGVDVEGSKSFEKLRQFQNDQEFQTEHLLELYQKDLDKEMELIKQKEEELNATNSLEDEEWKLHMENIRMLEEKIARINNFGKLESSEYDDKYQEVLDAYEDEESHSLNRANARSVESQIGDLDLDAEENHMFDVGEDDKKTKKRNFFQKLFGIGK